MSDRSDELAAVRHWAEIVNEHGVNATESRAAEAEIWREFAHPITNPATGMMSLRAPIFYATHEEAIAAMRTLRLLLTQRQMLMMAHEIHPDRQVGESGVLTGLTGATDALLMFLGACLELWGELPAAPEPAAAAEPVTDLRLHALMRSLGGTTHA